MGHKVHPLGFRLGYIKEWRSHWYSRKKGFADMLHEDIKIRDYMKEKLQQAGVSRIEIDRAANRVKVSIFTSRPGIIIGRRGADIDKLRDELQAMTGKEIYIDIKEIKDPSTDAQLVAENIAFQLEKRISHKRAMKKAVSSAMAQGSGGIRVTCAGRLGGAEMSRREGYREGKVPLHTLRADIDYGFAEAQTTYGIIGIKAWIYKGDIITNKESAKAEQPAETTGENK